jgi:hypothetical protein
VISTKPTTVVATNPLLGHGGTHIVQTVRDDGKFTIFVQVIDIGGGLATQIVLPDKVASAIYRQKQSLIDRSRRKPRPKLTPEQREQVKLREARKVIREAKQKKSEAGG